MLFSKKRKSFLDNLPVHVGIIMDGNGRWATKRFLPRNAGHKEGVNALYRVIKALKKFGIKYLSVFAFSTENWKRSKDEVDGIFNLIKENIIFNSQNIKDEDIKLVTSGDITKFPDELRTSLEETIEKTKDKQGFVLNLAINYGGCMDIVQAVNNLIKQGKKSITEEDITNNLYTKDLPPLDFVIRASGEQRISNFMLYQMAYSELYFPKTLWPDFDEKEIEKCLIEFSKRKRRYGGIK